MDNTGIPRSRALSTAFSLWIALFGIAVGCASSKTVLTEQEETDHREVAVAGQDWLPRNLLVADVQELAKIIEDSHPDPFTRAGGRIVFYRQVDAAVRSIPSEGMSRRDFFHLVRPLVAAVRDGHTCIYHEKGGKEKARIWIGLEPVGDGLLVVSRVYNEAHRSLLGSILESVADVSFAELVERMRTRRGYDNKYGNLKHLAMAVTSPASLADLLDLSDLYDAIPFTVRTPEGELRTVSIAVGASAPGRLIEPPSRLGLPGLNAADMAWTFLTETRKVAYLRIDSMRRYREAFEVWRSIGYTGLLGGHLDKVVKAAVPSSSAETVDEKIALVPSATEMFIDLFSAMGEAGTSFLVVDLRRNSGGNSFMGLILLHFLYSMETLVRADHGYSIPRYSTLYFDKYRNASIDEMRAQGIEVGDYDFKDEKEWHKMRRQGLTEKEYEARLHGLTNMALKSPTFGEVFTSRLWSAAWMPQVIVLTNAATYSAGFDLAAALVNEGARLVGVPSSQAGNCFIDTLDFELTYSRLQGNISRKQSLSYPGDLEKESVLEPHVVLTYERLSSLDFDPNATVLLALEMVAGWDLSSNGKFR